MVHYELTMKLQKQNTQIDRAGKRLFSEIAKLIENARLRVAISLNTETTLLNWTIGNYINLDLKRDGKGQYGARIVATVSQLLEERFGKGYTYTALARMCKVASVFGKQKVATLSQQLSWSHLIELTVIENRTKREFYTQMNLIEGWGVRDLREKIDVMLIERTAIAKKPEAYIKKALQKARKESTVSPELVFKSSYVLNLLGLPAKYSERELERALIGNLEQFILELGNGFAFIERQKRITVDTIDYHLDLLFFHRKLNRLVAVDLKIGKFKPAYKAQMQLYLRWLQKYEMQKNEEPPVGLILCSEGNTEHIELLMLDEKEIKVAQYLTQLPSKKWFADKLHRSYQIARQNNPEFEIKRLPAAIAGKKRKKP